MIWYMFRGSMIEFYSYRIHILGELPKRVLWYLVVVDINNIPHSVVYFELDYDSASETSSYSQSGILLQICNVDTSNLQSHKTHLMSSPCVMKQILDYILSIEITNAVVLRLHKNETKVREINLECLERQM